MTMSEFDPVQHPGARPIRNPFAEVGVEIWEDTSSWVNERVKALIQAEDAELERRIVQALRDKGYVVLEPGDHSVSTEYALDLADLPTRGVKPDRIPDGMAGQSSDLADPYEIREAAGHGVIVQRTVIVTPWEDRPEQWEE